MPYEDELKRRAVNAYRESDRSYRDVASEFGIAASTLSRWHYQTPTEKTAPPSSPYDAELVDVLDRLGQAADDGVKAYSRGQKHMQHLIIAAWILYVLVAVVLGFSVFFAGVRLYVGLPDEVRSQDVVLLPWMVLTAAAAFLAVGTVNGFLIRRFFPLPCVVGLLHEAEAELMNHPDKEIFLVSPFNFVRRIQGRGIKRNMNRAGRILSKRTVSGHHYVDPKAQEAEYFQRKSAASSLAVAEVQLHQKGTAAYKEVAQLLRTLIILTVLKDWNLADLPSSNQATSTYSSLSQRLWGWLKKAIGTGVSAAGTIHTIVASPEIPEFIRKLSDGNHLTFLPW
jgi:hypothetical protein